MLRKKGQHAGSQAAFIIVAITIVLVAYVLFLPPEEREALLDDDNGDGYFITASAKNATILNSTSMRLEYVGEDDIEHIIPNVYLSERIEANILEAYNPFYIRNGWFDKKTYEAVFYITDLAFTDNVALSFEAPKAQGNLLVSVNGVQIFDYETTQLNVGPVEIRNELLVEGENTLVFTVRGVGIKFWTTNEYSIEDAQITADLKDISQRTSLSTFTVTNEEYNNIESARLDFYPVCAEASVGTLEIEINNRLIYSAVPDCETINRFDIFQRDLNAGKNTISFMTTKGSYRVELIKLKTDLKDVKTYLDYFEINSTAYEEIEDGDKELWLEINFVDDGEDKEAEININGHLTYLDQRDQVYRRKIHYWVEEGARNYLEIKPFTVLKIVDLNVVLAEKD